MNALKFIDTERRLVASDKGPMGMDGTNPTCNKRFGKLGIAQTEMPRRAYWEVPAGCAPWRIQCRDGEDMSMTTRIPQLTQPAA